MGVKVCLPPEVHRFSDVQVPRDAINAHKVSSEDKPVEGRATVPVEITETLLPTRIHVIRKCIDARQICT